MRTVASCFRAALGIAILIEALGAIVLFLGYFIFEGLSGIMVAIHSPSIQLLPFWDDSHFGNSPYLWMLAVILLQFVFWFLAAIASIYSCSRWKKRRQTGMAVC